MSLRIEQSVNIAKPLRVEMEVQMASMLVSVLSVNGKTGVVNLQASDVGAIPTTEKGVANGVAELDENGKVPLLQLPENAIESLADVALSGQFSDLLGIEDVPTVPISYAQIDNLFN